MLLILSKDEAEGDSRIIGSARFAFSALAAGFAVTGRGRLGRGFEEAPGRELLVACLRRPRNVSECLRTWEKSYVKCVSPAKSAPLCLQRSTCLTVGFMPLNAEL